MSVFDLQKRQEAVKFILEKRDIKQAPVMRVGAALDVSGSAQHLYNRGVMQHTIDRLVPVAMRFDDNGEMDVWSFDSGFNQLATVSKMDYEDFIVREVLNRSDISKWGGTNYSGVMNDMASFYFGGGKAAKAAAAVGGLMGKLGGLFGSRPAPAAAPAAVSNVPAMALLVTDGANQDRAASAKVLRDARSLPIYWQLIGVGDPREFAFLQEMADELPNVGFVHLTNLNLTDEQLYEALLSDELCTWVKRI